jgi:hypothetical protein
MVGDSSDGKIKPESVQILLHEYDTLRQEILQKTSNIYQIIAIIAAVLVAVLNWFGSNDANVIHIIPPSPLYLYSLFVAELGLAYAWAIIGRDIWKAAARVKEIEKSIDDATGEWYLLRWERLWGGSERGIFGLSRHAPVPPRAADLDSRLDQRLSD